MEHLIPAHSRDKPLIDNAGCSKKQYESRRIRNKSAAPMQIFNGKIGHYWESALSPKKRLLGLRR